MDTQSKQQFSHNEKVSLEKHEASVDTIDAIGDDHHAVLTTILKERPVRIWDKNSLHLYAVCLLIYLCSTMNGLSTPSRRLRFPVLTDYFNRLRRISHGFNQCRTELYSVLQSPTRRQQRHRTCVCDFPDRTDGRSTFLLGRGLAWTPLADLHWMPRHLPWCRCDLSLSDHSSVHRRSFHAIVLLDNRNGRSSDLLD